MRDECKRGARDPTAAGGCATTLVAVSSDANAPQAEALLKIGEVCDRVGLSLRTVRYYEEVGLFAPTGRSPGGFRLYSEADVQRLRTLKGMKPFGLSLSEIRDLMALLDLAQEDGARDGADAGDAPAQLRAYTARAEDRVRQLEAHVAEVQGLRERILRAVEQLEA